MSAFREVVSLTPAEVELYDDIMCLIDDYKECEINEHEIIGDRPAGMRLVEMGLKPTFHELACMLYTEHDDFDRPLDFETERTEDGIFISEDPDGGSNVETAANLIRILKWHDLPRTMNYVSMPDRRDTEVNGGVILITKEGVSFMPNFLMREIILQRAKTGRLTDIRHVFSDPGSPAEAS